MNNQEPFYTAEELEHELKMQARDYIIEQLEKHQEKNNEHD